MPFELGEGYDFYAEIEVNVAHETPSTWKRSWCGPGPDGVHWKTDPGRDSNVYAYTSSITEDQLKFFAGISSSLQQTQPPPASDARTAAA